MTDFALQIAGSKLAISIVLGAAVWLAARGSERPQLSHALCLTLFAALLIPPLIALPVLTPGVPTPGPAEAVTFSALQVAGPLVESGRGGFTEYGGFGLVLAWILGGAAIVAWTMARARTFRASMERASRGACPDLQGMAEEIGRTLGLKEVPTIETTDAVVSPMVYWGGGTARVLIPSALLEGMEPSQLRWILAHELAHVRRGDHWVRWLEWLACTVFWWNPIAWWARRRLRAAEEVCCDAMVVRAIGCTPRDYARSLVRALDLVRTDGTSSRPAFASAAHSGRRTRHLEKRLRMIITNRPDSILHPALRLALRGGFVASLALGLIYCSEQTWPTAESSTAAESPTVDLTDAPRHVVRVLPIREEEEEPSWSWYVGGGATGLPFMVVSGTAPLPTRAEQERLLAELAEVPPLPEGSRYEVFFHPNGEGKKIRDVARKYEIVYPQSSSPWPEMTMTAGPQLTDATNR